jgi:hypothetical protein
MRFVFLSIAATVVCAVTAAAQDISSHRHDRVDGTRNVGHAENHDWYKDLKQPGTGYSCCNGTANGVAGDCRPTCAWMPVPPRVVLQKLAPDGNSHICAGKSGMIYCFIGGPPKS